MVKQNPQLTIEGALMSAVVACLMVRDSGKLMVFSSALSQYQGDRYWVIEGFRDQEGTITNYTKLDVASAEAARTEVKKMAAPWEALRRMRELVG